MATIRTDTGRIADISSEFVSLSRDTQAYAQAVASARCKLASEVKAHGNLNASLSEVETRLLEIAKKLQLACMVATNSAESFARADREAKEHVVAGSGGGTSGSGSGSGSSSNSSSAFPSAPTILQTNTQFTPSTIKVDNPTPAAPLSTSDKVKSTGIAAASLIAGKALGAGISSITKYFGVEGGSGGAVAEADISGLHLSESFDHGTSSGSAELKLANANAKASADYVFDPAKGDIAAKASAEASLAAIKASANYKSEHFDASVNAEIGSVKAVASAETSLMRGGSFNPKLNVKASAEASAAKGAADFQARGGDGYMVGGTAAGKLASATAGAEANFDVEKGSFGFEAGALAAAASGSASIGADLGPVKGSVKVTGYAGGAGVKANASFKDGEFTFGAGGALGVGGGVEFSVGLGNWANKIDEATGGAVGDATSALGNAASAALSPVNAVVGAGKSLFDSGKDIVNAVKSGDVGGTVKALVTAPLKAAQAVGSAVVSGAKAVGNAIASGAKAVGKGVATVAKTIWKGLTSW